jgi:Protein of unknown function (DUF3828)
VNRTGPPADKADMLTRRTMILGCAATAVALSIATPVLAADPAAESFVADIYKTYKGKDAKGVPLDNARTVRRLFEPSLATLLIEDQRIAAKRREVGLLDSDPFLDAQDWEIADFDIAIADTGPDTAIATVKFVNFKEPQTVVLALIKTKDGWRIHDITWPRDGKPGTLRGLYAHGMFPR